MTGLETAPRREVEIEFLYLDLEVCGRCRGTDASLETALRSVAGVLEAADVNVRVSKTRVDSEEQARSLGFASSPTIRVDGRDVALEFRESPCESEACACGNDSIQCRVWVYRGEEYTEAPVPLIVDAVLSAVYHPQRSRLATPTPAADIPENLRRFFRGRPDRPSASCCDRREQESCCAPSEKEACCGVSNGTAVGSCGCQ